MTYPLRIVTAMLEDDPIATVVVPVRTVSGNKASTQHWRHRWGRAKKQHEAVAWALVNGLTLEPWGMARNLKEPVHVHLTRLAPRKLDTDNLAGALKHVRDAVAKFLGCDDGDEAKVTWSVGQEPAKGHSVRVEFYRRNQE